MSWVSQMGHHTKNNSPKLPSVLCQGTANLTPWESHISGSRQTWSTHVCLLWSEIPATAVHTVQEKTHKKYGRMVQFDSCRSYWKQLLLKISGKLHPEATQIPMSPGARPPCTGSTSPWHIQDTRPAWQLRQHLERSESDVTSQRGQLLRLGEEPAARQTWLTHQAPIRRKAAEFTGAEPSDVSQSITKWDSRESLPPSATPLCSISLAVSWFWEGPRGVKASVSPLGTRWAAPGGWLWKGYPTAVRGWGDLEQRVSLSLHGPGALTSPSGLSMGTPPQQAPAPQSPTVEVKGPETESSERVL